MAEKKQITIVELRKKARALQQKHWVFRSMLKAADLADLEIDGHVAQCADELLREIDCTKCGNCCRELTPVLSDADVKRIARFTGENPDTIRRDYCQLIDTGALTLQKPCPFLKQKKCSIYKYRPRDCKSYPHLHKKHFRARLTSMFSNRDICPIIFFLFEKLGQRLEGKLDENQITWM